MANNYIDLPVEGGGSGTGTVTSVDVAVPTGFTSSGGPVTTSGTITIGLSTETANFVWAGPTTGAAAAPAFRALVGADLPNPSSSTLGGVQSKASVSNQFLTSISTSGVPASAQPAFTNISGNISVSQMNSGTSASSSTFWRGDGTWVAPTSGVTTVGTFSATSIANGASISGVTITLGVGDGTNPGMISTTTQTIAGNKSFSGVTTMAAGVVTAPSLNWGDADSGLYKHIRSNAHQVSMAIISVDQMVWQDGGGRGTRCIDQNGVGNYTDLAFNSDVQQFNYSSSMDTVQFNFPGQGIGVLQLTGGDNSGSMVVWPSTDGSKPNQVALRNYHVATNAGYFIENLASGQTNLGGSGNVSVIKALALSTQRIDSPSSTVTINDNVSDLVLHNGSTIVSETVTMPANPIDGQIVTITCNRAITTLTVSANTGQTITTSISTLPLGSSASFKYILADTNWYPWG